MPPHSCRSMNCQQCVHGALRLDQNCCRSLALLEDARTVALKRQSVARELLLHGGGVGVGSLERESARSVGLNQRVPFGKSAGFNRDEFPRSGVIILIGIEVIWIVGSKDPTVVCMWRL